jgi:quercetin dioxygenase-like cupin family protein
VPNKAGYIIARAADIPWEERRNVDGWPSRAGMYYNDRDNNLCMRLIDYAEGLTEPRHVHSGSHAAVLLEGEAHIDGITLHPLDVILGPSNEPHGPIVYPKGVKIFSAFQGSYFHNEVGELGPERHYRLIQAGEVAWEQRGDGLSVKTLIDHGLGRLLLEVLRFDHGAKLMKPAITAALVVDGSATIADESLGARDFFYVPKGGKHEPVVFSGGATLLAVTMR